MIRLKSNMLRTVLDDGHMIDQLHQHNVNHPVLNRARMRVGAIVAQCQLLHTMLKYYTTRVYRSVRRINKDSFRWHKDYLPSYVTVNHDCINRHTIRPYFEDYYQVVPKWRESCHCYFHATRLPDQISNKNQEQETGTVFAFQMKNIKKSGKDRLKTLLILPRELWNYHQRLPSAGECSDEAVQLRSGWYSDGHYWCPNTRYACSVHASIYYRQHLNLS